MYHSPVLLDESIESLEINENGERSFSYWRDQSPTRQIFLGSEGKHLLNDISNADIFYYSGISAGILDAKQKKQLIKVGTTAKVCAFDFGISCSAFPSEHRCPVDYKIFQLVHRLH